MSLKPSNKIISLLLGIVGLFLIIFSVYPIAEYEYISRKRFPKILSPLSDSERYSILSTPVKNYKNLKNWSSEYELKTEEKDKGFYTLSVPRLGIKNALVSEGGEDLSKNLIQYPGTAKPGEMGNDVVFGHSVLPVFFDPKNYLTIFSTLPKLKEGDEIIVNTDSVVYKYKIVNMYEVSPDNLDILDQRLDGSYLSLVTCVPPGHPLKPRRLVVKAQLQIL